MPPAERLAAWLDSYHRGLKPALHAAAADGFPLITLGALRDELDPRSFPQSARRHFRRYVRDLGLQLDATAAVFPGAGLADAAAGQERLARLDAALRLSAELDVRRAIANIAGWSDPQRRPLAAAALEQAAALADRYGVQLAVQARGAEIDALLADLRRLNCPSLALAIDTAAVDLRGAGVAARLRREKASTEARSTESEARATESEARATESEARSAEFFAGSVGAVLLRDFRTVGEQVEETVLGDGEVDFARVLGELASADYRGALTVRTERAGSVDALRRGREYVANLLRAGEPRNIR